MRFAWLYVEFVLDGNCWCVGWSCMYTYKMYKHRIRWYWLGSSWFYLFIQWLLGISCKQPCFWLGLVKVNRKGLIKMSQFFILGLCNVKPVNLSLSLINVCQCEANNLPSLILWLKLWWLVIFKRVNLSLFSWKISWCSHKLCAFWSHLLPLTHQGSFVQLWQCLIL